MDKHFGEHFYLPCTPLFPVDMAIEFINFFHLMVASARVTFEFNLSFFTSHEFAGCIYAALHIVWFIIL